VWIGLNLTTVIWYQTKNAPDVLQLWKKTNCEKIGKSWKIYRLIYIVSTFFIVIKKLQTIGKNFCTDLINAAFFCRRQSTWSTWKVSKDSVLFPFSIGLNVSFCLFCFCSAKMHATQLPVVFFHQHLCLAYCKIIPRSCARSNHLCLHRSRNKYIVIYFFIQKSASHNILSPCNFFCFNEFGISFMSSFSFCAHFKKVVSSFLIFNN